ncbi:hypothetical protein B0T17DRAFT_493950 [Bombardia bombarda]|uniref:NECAP PHear domain-containing protein n=1 Tax=Bombardia bombarda TaxID=252184 RepID=A0AA39WU04_9PEZI|nr:hypothetical protein B0T17DRAFT_493950 [Bombardia bombarda]
MEATTLDPATGRPLPPDAIQRILHIAKAVHVYSIPPLTSTKGYNAASWTEDPKRHIFTCRARVIETAVPDLSSPGGADKVRVDIVLEDASTGHLFAAAPYTSPAAVEPTLDSSRFFALRVQDPLGRKATLGMGFEERSDAFDFNIALQEAQRALGLLGDNFALPGGAGNSSNKGGKAAQQQEDDKKDYSLKDGETITVNLSGTRFGRRARASSQAAQQQLQQVDLFSGLGGTATAGSGSGGLSSFALPPPPSSSASEIKSRRRQSAQALGFDDGPFGEFA